QISYRVTTATLAVGAGTSSLAQAEAGGTIGFLGLGTLGTTAWSLAGPWAERPSGLAAGLPGSARVGVRAAARRARRARYREIRASTMTATPRARRRAVTKVLMTANAFFVTCRRGSGAIEFGEEPAQ